MTTSSEVTGATATESHAEAPSPIDELPTPERESGPPSKPDAATLLDRMQRAQTRDGIPSAKERTRRLDALERAVLDHMDAIAAAMREDFGNKSKHEALISEVYLVLLGLRQTRARFREWMQPEAREVPLALMPGQAEVIPQPVGVVGIVSPWNYPIQLALLPLVGALAAGCRAILKPSEVVPRTSQVLADLVRSAFEPDVVSVVLGDHKVGEAFTRLPFDHLVFTGSTHVGRLVMKAASDHLVPVTLELGGKSPVIFGPDADLRTAVMRTMAGNIWNAGQTCVAPDYVLAPRASFDRIVEEAKRAVGELLPRIVDNPDYTSIVSDRHYTRLQGLIADAKDKGARVEVINPAGESIPAESRKIAPTLVVDANESMLVMQEEIFGPVLPIVAADSLDEAIAFVNDHPRPLALYYFGHKTADIDRVIERTRSGGVTINDTLLHAATEDLPFGGIGASGMGAYHGREGFDTFTKKRPVYYQSRVTGRRLLAPPFGRALDVILKVLIGR